MTNEMTNEEAKAIMIALKQSYINLKTKSDLKKETVKENIKAYNMAIKALEQGDALRELRQEIVGIRDCEEERPNRFGCDKLIAYERVIDLVDTKIKELSE